MLPEDNKKILGPSHPFLDEVTRDLIELCHHRNAGDFVICGWRISGRPFSFPAESGSHARPGPEETKAFALLPADMPLAYRHGNYLRPIDLRRSAFQLLGRSKIKISKQLNRQGTRAKRFASCRGRGWNQIFFLPNGHFWVMLMHGQTTMNPISGRLLPGHLPGKLSKKEAILVGYQENKSSIDGCNNSVSHPLTQQGA